MNPDPSISPSVSPITPSASISVPLSQEHIEARQAAIDVERRAYIETLTPEQRERFEAMERAVKILEDAKILYWLTAHPFPNGANGLWEYNKFTYQSIDTEEGRREGSDFSQKVLWHVLMRFIRFYQLFISIYNRDRQFMGVWGPDGEVKPMEPNQ